jgi:TPP-dependent pyruvate/acetoin dehydrogenase alpha subunit
MTPVFAGGCLRALVEKRSGVKSEPGKKAAMSAEQGVLFGSGLIAGEGVMGIGVAIAALILGQRPPGVAWAFIGLTGSIVSLVGFAALGWLLYRSAQSRS